MKGRNKGPAKPKIVKQSKLGLDLLGKTVTLFSAIIVGKRKMTGDELLAFCMALEVSPDEFTKREVV